MSILASRNNTLYKNQDYKIPSKGLIRGWKITSEVPDNLYPVLSFGEEKLNIPRKDRLYISLEEIRKYIRNIEVPESLEETRLLTLEHLFFGFQLAAMTFYPSLSSEELENSLFTRDIKDYRITFNGNDEDSFPEAITVEEDYWDRSKDEPGLLTL